MGGGAPPYLSFSIEMAAFFVQTTHEYLNNSCFQFLINFIVFGIVYLLEMAKKNEFLSFYGWKKFRILEALNDLTIIH